MSWFVQALKKYAVFSGRSRRKEYWYFVLFVVLIQVVLTIIDASLGTLHRSWGVGLLTGIFNLAILIPGLAVSVRRLHDTDRSGWWILLGLIPIIGPIILIVFYVQDSTPANRYGPNPKRSPTYIG